MPEVTIGEVRIAYERAGEGPPLVLLHGLFGIDFCSWRHRFLRALPRGGIITVYVDPCGHGGVNPHQLTAHHTLTPGATMARS